MKTTTYSFISSVCFFLVLFGISSSYGQKRDVSPAKEIITPIVSANAENGKIYRFSNNAGEELFIETAFDLFQRGNSVYLSRFELKEGRFIAFKIKNSSALSHAEIKISYTQSGMEKEDFLLLKKITIANDEGWQYFEFQPETDNRSKTFLKWEFITPDSQEERGDVNISPVQKSFLDHKILAYSQFQKLLKGGDQSLMITIENESHRLVLKEVNILAADYRITLFDGKNKRAVKLNNQAKTYAGVDITTGGKVRLTVAENFVSGFIETGEDIYHIEPARFIEKSAPDSRLIMYNTRDAAPHEEVSCGVKENTEDPIRKWRENFRSNNEGDRTTSDCRIVDYAIACDYSMFVKYNSSVIDLVNRNLAVMNNVQANYIDQFERNYIFEINEQFLVTESGGDPWTSSTNVDLLLNDFTNWGPSGFTAVHDVAAFWSNRDFDGSTVGYAWVGAVCSPYKYSINQDFTSNQQSIRVLLAHETGHNFGANHDASGAPYIMAPSVNPSAVNFSAQSFNQVKSYMDSGGACATSCPVGSDPVCGANFYDSGGADEKYGNNEVITTTICPDNEGDIVKVLFNFFKTESGVDFLSCYNGNDIHSPEIWTHSGLDLPPVNPVVGENPSGCLTFQFISNGNVVNDGWAAAITCQEGGTCPAPVALSFVSVDETSGELSWTEIGFGTSYDIEYGEAGFTMTGIPDIVGTTDNPYLLSGLDQGVEYEFYVRSNCEGEDSNWSGPYLFNLGPVNNTCADAIPVPLNYLGDCPGAAVVGSTSGATQAGSDISSCNAGNGNYTDVWYTFDTGSNSTISFDIEALGATHLGMQLYLNNCSSVIYTNCNVTDFLGQISGFPLNTVIIVRFFTDITIGEQGDFSFCFSSTTADIENNTCSEALSVTPFATCVYTGGTTIGATNSIPKISCNGFTAGPNSGDVWYSFEADGFSNYIITLDMTVDAVLVLYTNTCGNLEYLDCADNNFEAGIEEIETGVLIEGIYYIRIFGWDLNGNFDLCVVSSTDYSISEVTQDQCTSFSEIESFGDQSVWTNVTDGSDNIIAALNLNEVDPGIEFMPTLYISSEIREDATGLKYINRDITIESSSVSFSSPVPVRLFYSQEELDDLIANDESVNSIADVNITKATTDCQGSFTGLGEFIPQLHSGIIENTYFIEIEVTSFSTFFAHGGQVALPVTLISFTGEASAEGNTIAWKVAEEINVEKYDIERSVDGRQFSTLFSEPSSSSTNNYSILDRTAPVVAYYRLKAVDWTGEYKYSSVIRIMREDGLAKIEVRPNPVRHFLKISGENIDMAEYQIMDVSGRILRTGKTADGENIDVAWMEAGVYILTVSLEGHSEIIKFIKI